MMIIENPEVQQFICQSMVARIATLSHSGRPSVTPLYFSFVGGHIWLGTADWTLAAREANADPRVCVLFQHEQKRQDCRILRVTGTAVVRTDDDTVRVRNRQQAFKYVLTPSGLLNQVLHLHLSSAVRRYRAQSKEKGRGCVIDVTPQRVEFLNYTQTELR